MKRMKLKTKLMVGFAMVSLVTLAVGFVGWSGVSGLGDRLRVVADDCLPSVQSLLSLRMAAESIRTAQRTLLNPALKPKDRERQFENVSRAREGYASAWKAYDAMSRTPEEDAVWKKFTATWDALREKNDTFIELARELEKTAVLEPAKLLEDIERFRGDHFRLLTLVSRAVLAKSEFEGGGDPKQCGFGTWLAAYQTDNPRIASALKEVGPVHDRFHQGIARLKDLIRKEDTDAAAALFTSELVPGSDAIVKQLAALKEEAAKASSIYEKMNELALTVAYARQAEAFALLDQLIEYNGKEADLSRVDGRQMANRGRVFTLVGMVLGVAVALVLGIFLSISITRPLQRVIEGIGEGADQVASASGEVASASQDLAEGSSRQAAAIEETSSSLEEMSSMTRQNAENSRQANTSMNDTVRVAEEALISMKELTNSMEEISKASEETQKIVKTIDEIAFQTNLLALNAAVEAARAGEAGAGFAVVADEVRNLAMRAADAARSTAGLIEGTVKKVKNGSVIVVRAGEAFEKVAGGARKVGELLGEITAASSEQAQGIEQLNKGVSEMDKVTQQNAANAEESASAAEEMYAQAENMREYVGELVGMLGGSENLGRGRAGRQSEVKVVATGDVSSTVRPREARYPSLKQPEERRNRPIARYGENRGEVSPERLIPFERDEEEDF